MMNDEFLTELIGPSNITPNIIRLKEYVGWLMRAIQTISSFFHKSQSVKEALGCELVAPNITRWTTRYHINSYFSG